MGVPDLCTGRAEKPISSASNPSTWSVLLWTGSTPAMPADGHTHLAGRGEAAGRCADDAQHAAERERASLPARLEGDPLIFPLLKALPPGNCPIAFEPLVDRRDVEACRRGAGQMPLVHGEVGTLDVTA